MWNEELSILFFFFFVFLDVFFLFVCWNDIGIKIRVKVERVAKNWEVIGSLLIRNVDGKLTRYGKNVICLWLKRFWDNYYNKIMMKIKILWAWENYY